MNPGPRKLQQRTENQAEQEHKTTAEQRQQATTRELTTVEDILRHDAERTSVPPAVAERLQNSISNEAPRRKGWLARLFSR
ncbi:MAG: hypothetical protein L0Y58_02715 [Verrucomicrobia subdivision 3 bacterium]|nr:hypothetical protein [Limisphaerales bacterium]